MRMGLGLGLTQPQGGFNPASLFADGGNGILWDFTTTGPLFTDSAGTTPLTTAAQTIGMVRDGSRTRSPATAYAGVQASAGLRPSYGIAPVSRRQLATYSENFDNAAWVKTNATVTANAAVAPDGTTTADKLTPTAVLGQHRVDQTTTIAAGTYTFSCYAKGDGYGFLWLRIGSSPACIFSLADGSTSELVGGTASASSVGSGWWRVSVNGSALVNSTVRLNALSASNSADFTGDGTSGVLIWGAQLESAGAVTAYQKSVTALEITESGFASYGYTRPDRADDVLSTVLTLAQTGDVMVFGRTASKIELGLIYGAGSTFSVGPTTVTGMTAGLLASVGDILAVIAVGRTLTATEKTLTHNYYTALGAGALI